MQKINSTTSLRDAIVYLEKKQFDEKEMLKEQFHLAYNSMRPINLIKSTFKEATASMNLKESVLNTSLGLASGYLSKKIFEGASRNPIKRFFGSALMFAIINLVAKNSATLKLPGKKLLDPVKITPGERVKEI